MTIDTPLVSIITPTYNHEKYIAECMRSAQAQTYSNWEMIIVNDGSTDNTEKIINECMVNDPRIKLFNQNNIGVFRLGETYNFALSKSQGKYIAILEGDDLWEPEKLFRQINAMEKNPLVILCWGKVYSVKDDLSRVYEEHPSCKPSEVNYYNNKPIGSILNLLYFENYIPALTILARKENLVRAGGFIQNPGLPLIDLPTLLELSILGEFFFDKTILGKWRIYPNQITKTYPVEIIRGRYKAAKNSYVKLPVEIRNNFHFQEANIDKYFTRILHIGYARSGRYKLIRKKFSDARKDYLHAIFYKGTINFSWRLRAIIGFIFSLCQIDIEWLAKLLGKKSYKN